MVRHVGGKRATVEQRQHLYRLHLEVYGFHTVETGNEIEGMSWIRAAQETAQLTRALDAKRRLTDLRLEAVGLHRRLFGRSYDRVKAGEILLMDERRVRAELVTLRRMTGDVIV